MIELPPVDATAPVIVVDIGNTTTTLALWHEEKIKMPIGVATNDREQCREALQAHVDSAPAPGASAAVICSVYPSALKRMRQQVADVLDRHPLVIGETIPLPMDVGVRDSKAMGVDRICGAYAAYATLQRACVVADFGTAVTVDLVSDDGILLGGAILPGLGLQFQALHEHTAALPLVEVADSAALYGRDTAEAMLVGVVRGLAGAVRGIVEGYATHLNHWPQVVATGGDAHRVQPFCDFVDSYVTSLTLRGIGISYAKHLAELGA